MTELCLILLVAAVLALHVRSADRWDAERARLVSALTAPTPIAAHAALSAPASPKTDDESPRARRTPIGEG